MRLSEIMKKLGESSGEDFECWDCNFFSIPYYDYESVFGRPPPQNYDPHDMGLRDDDMFDHFNTNGVLMGIPPAQLEEIIRLWEKTPDGDYALGLSERHLMDNIEHCFLDLCDHCVDKGVYLPDKILKLYWKVKETL